MITTEQAKRMIVDVRKSNPNIVAGFAILPKDQYSSSNELYSEISAYYYKALEELKEKNIVSSTNGGYGQNFSTYGFPYEIPNMEQLDCIFCYIDIINNNFRWKVIFRYITNDEVEYATTLRIAFIQGNDRLS
jgi:hypothetical protein